MTLNYRRYSQQGRPLLILHGLFGSLANWGWHCKQLAGQYAVIAVDLRNHGDSPHADAMNYPVMADDVRELLDSLAIESCALIGHSMGGKVAMQLALTYPDYVDPLVVVDIAPVAYTGKSDGHLKILEAMQALDMTSIENRGDAETKLATVIKDKATRQFILTNIVRADDGSYGWRLNLDAIEKNYDRLREKPQGDVPFMGPTLFVRGDLSGYIHKKHERQILALFPNASVKTIMETGHWVHAEKPQVFQTVVRGFLQQEESDP